MGWFDPGWVKKLPANLRPDGAKVSQLESLRREFDLSHDTFYVLVIQSPGITKMMFEQQFAQTKNKDPRATNQDVFEYILQMRHFSNKLSHGMSIEDARADVQQAFVLSAINAAAARMRGIDDLMRYIDAEEGFWDNTPDPYHINSRVSEMLGYVRTPMSNGGHPPLPAAALPSTPTQIPQARLPDISPLIVESRQPSSGIGRTVLAFVAVNCVIAAVAVGSWLFGIYNKGTIETLEWAGALVVTLVAFKTWASLTYMPEPRRSTIGAFGCLALSIGLSVTATATAGFLLSILDKMLP